MLAVDVDVVGQGISRWSTALKQSTLVEVVVAMMPFVGPGSQGEGSQRPPPVYDALAVDELVGVEVLFLDAACAEDESILGADATSMAQMVVYTATTSEKVDTGSESSGRQSEYLGGGDCARGTVKVPLTVTVVVGSCVTVWMEFKTSIAQTVVNTSTTFESLEIDAPSPPGGRK